MFYSFSKCLSCVTLQVIRDPLNDAVIHKVGLNLLICFLLATTGKPDAAKDRAIDTIMTSASVSACLIHQSTEYLYGTLLFNIGEHLSCFILNVSIVLSQIYSYPRSKRFKPTYSCIGISLNL